jgi:surface polysaccharide O-acyltransferase-like enzyme
VGNAIDSAARWCIGVFVMVSGALLLAPDRPESASRFYAKRLRRILVPTLFWSAAYLGLDAANGRPMSLAKAGDELWHGRPGYHMWYLFMILGLYAATPALRQVVTRLARPARWATIASLFITASAYDLGCALWQWPRPDVVPLMFLPYLGYFLCGHELRNASPGPRGRALACGIALLAIVATAVGTRALLELHGPTLLGLFLYEFLSPNVIAMSIAVFLLAAAQGGLAAGAQDSALRRFIVRMAPLTLGIYLVHPMVISGLRGVGIQAIGDPVLGVFEVALPAFAVSAAITFAMSRVRGLRECVGLG